MESNNSTKVSVIMPVYNSELYLRESIESVLTQSFTDFEFIIIDDGSSDNSLSIIKSYNDERINVVINEENLGIVDSLNKALMIAKGTYIARMDADDICHKDRLSIQVEFLEKYHDIGCCGSFVQILNTNKIIKHEHNPGKLHSNLLFKSDISHPAVMIRKSILLDNNIKYNKSYTHAEDYRLWTEIAAKSKLANINEVLLYYRLHYQSVSHIYSKEQRKNALLIQKQLLEELGINERFDISIHQDIVLQTYIYNFNFLNKIIDWFEFLKLQNKKKKVFELASFQQIIDEKIKLTKLHFRLVLDLIKNIKENGYSVYIWGASELGKRDLEVLIKSGVKVAGFIDSNKNKINQTINNYKIYSPDDILPQNNSFIFISSIYYEQIFPILEANSFQKYINYVCLLEEKEPFK
ncbi:glycosyltransferase [Niallia circulans]|uniref:glycosyltransferase n=1 Tax=Niallia circulans TaxID=1397 RepID=UPI0035248EBC